MWIKVILWYYFCNLFYILYIVWWQLFVMIIMRFWQNTLWLKTTFENWRPFLQITTTHRKTACRKWVHCPIFCPIFFHCPIFTYFPPYFTYFWCPILKKMWGVCRGLINFFGWGQLFVHSNMIIPLLVNLLFENNIEWTFIVVPVYSILQSNAFNGIPVIVNKK